MEPKYHIKYAESTDGIHWKRHGTVAIELMESEYGIASASVLKENSLYKMWYSYRKGANYRTAIHDSYRIGYAESLDGIKWLRKDGHVGLDLSVSGCTPGSQNPRFSVSPVRCAERSDGVAAIV